MDYVRLSDDPNDGLLMWITVGVNTTADYDSLAGAAAHLYEEGGVAATGGFGGFGGGGGPPGGGPPGGGPPGGGFPGFPTSSAGGASPTAQTWGPCKKAPEAEGE